MGWSQIGTHEVSYSEIGEVMALGIWGPILTLHLVVSQPARCL
ncbi:uncharacterized protein G2W53_030847 [Senna tora]|uniref:Uncharacterized protein n=1 Tax=Senna tora TaxID=362788 RepID=A0A834T6Q8_9FABA|nr:uncharacterized protein G2W53_030847 [Senna tora]